MAPGEGIVYKGAWHFMVLYGGINAITLFGAVLHAGRFGAGLPEITLERLSSGMATGGCHLLCVCFKTVLITFLS